MKGHCKPSLVCEPKTEEGVPAPLSTPGSNEDKNPHTNSTGVQENKHFHEMGLDDRILLGISNLGWDEPTLIQASAIPHILEGKDVLARARTGSGKTGAFLIPLLQKILDGKQVSMKQASRGLILAPTRELCRQIQRGIGELASSCSRHISFLDVSPQVDFAAQRPLLLKKPDIVIGTPGRIASHIRSGSLDISNIELLIIDEADLVFSFGFEEDVKKIIGKLKHGYQAVLMSATLTPDVLELKRLTLHNPVILKLEEPQLPPVTQLTQYHIKVEEMEKFVLIYAMLKLQLIHGKTIIFVKSVDRSFKVKLFLEQFGIPSCVLNAELPMASRCHTVAQFNDGLYQVIVASDDKALVLPASQESNSKPPSGKKRKRKADKESGVSRGIDFQNVSNIINLDFPPDVDTYIHRVGRTARGRNTGYALSLVSVKEVPQFEQVQAALHEMYPEVENVCKPYQFRLEEVEPLRYRAMDAYKSVTRIAVREARLKEIRHQLLASQKLKGYFEDNPSDLEVLRHDTALHTVKLQPNLKEIPEYAIPAPLRAAAKRHRLSQPHSAKLRQGKPSVAQHRYMGIENPEAYILYTSGGGVLSSASTLESLGISDGDILYLGYKDKEGTMFKFGNWWLISFLTGVIGLGGLVTCVVLFVQGRSIPFDYGVVLDGGSSHTQTTVYKWREVKANGTGIVEQVSTCRIDGGMDKLDPLNDTSMESYFKKCLQSAHNTVPSSIQASTPLYLAATGGMRLKQLADPTAADLLLSKTQEILGHSGLNLQSVRVINGVEEGAAGWVSLNYLLDNFGDYSMTQKNIKSYRTEGALDLGGASAQITFERGNADSSTPDSQVSLMLYGRRYNLFSHSFLCFGVVEAKKRFLSQLVLEAGEKKTIDNACGAVGSRIVVSSSYLRSNCTHPLSDGFSPNAIYTFNGTGDVAECKEKISKLLNATKCSEQGYPYCFNSSVIPEFNVPFYGFSTFAFLMADFELSIKPNETEYLAKINSTCQKDFSKQSSTQAINSADVYNITSNCFTAQYMYELLDAYGLTGEKWKTITFTEQVNGATLGWSLGYMINATNTIPEEAPPTPYLETPVFSLLVVLFSAFILTAVAFAYHALKLRRNAAEYQRFSSIS